ncbi:hypothetical protein U0C82_06595 [Fulvimarina sp. 2208YS6-2-32]|uniref:BrnA antitoxin of type II toxin-antitoxin system n=1 Tax=Fulvimarina uroteuthidis TaxID=3098149 RepID=A0ABU5I1G7_9HYPH|nr:hypothetical protein [Fulvimarina sp. 2208YS6-2-32]MDY8108813.1 hypothetical protein [Fulvimarina sp. 2208YS6-2-32]
MKKRWQTEPISDEEDAAITAAALSDPDNPPLTDEEMDRMRPARDVMPRDLFEKLTGTRAVFVPAEVVDHFKTRFGPDWEEEMRDVLRAAAQKDEGDGREAAE